MSDEVWYCGFNGFKQVPAQADRHTLTSLVLQQPKPLARNIVDVAVCWNYLVVAEPHQITKYGLVEGRHGLERLCLPPGNGTKFVQVSATPRHLLAVTDAGECWTYEETKGWRQIQVGVEQTAGTPDTEKEAPLIEMIADAPENKVTPEPETKVQLTKTSCGDAHNIGLDVDGKAYSLPSPLDFDPFPSGTPHKVTDLVCGKEHCLLLTEHGQVYSWGGGSRGQLGHGTLSSEEKPRLVSALDGMRVSKIAAGGWHSAIISQFDDLYMFGWNESGQLAQPTNLTKPAECFSAVEKLLMSCCTMQSEDAALPRGDADDCEVYHKNDEKESSSVYEASEIEKDTMSCYTTAACNTETDQIVVQALPMLVAIPGSGGKEDATSHAVGVSCGSRHTVILTKANVLWAFGWNKYGQLGIGHTASQDSLEKVCLPKSFGRNTNVKMVRCGDWGTAVVVSPQQGESKK